MSEDTFRMFYTFLDPIKTGLIEDLITQCFHIGCTTTQEGRIDVCKLQSEKFDWIPKTTDTERAIDIVTTSNRGGVEFWYKDLRFDLEVNWDSQFVPDIPHFALKIWSSQFRSCKEENNSDVTERVLQFLEIARSLAEISDPDYAYGSISKYNAEEIGLTEQAIETGQIQKIFWVNIFSELIISQIGEKRLLSAPAWKVEKLDTDSILLVVNDYPRAYEDKAAKIAQYLNMDDGEFE